MRLVLSLVTICVLVLTPRSQGSLLVDNCLASLNDVPGCLQEVLSSFLTIRIHIGPACCKALLEIEDKCWSKAFPYITPTYPFLIRTFCSTPPPHQKPSSYAQNLASPPAPARKNAWLMLLILRFNCVYEYATDWILIMYLSLNKIGDREHWE